MDPQAFIHDKYMLTEMPTALRGFNSITCLYDKEATLNFPHCNFSTLSEIQAVFPCSASRWQLRLIKQDTLKLGGKDLSSLPALKNRVLHFF